MVVLFVVAVEGLQPKFGEFLDILLVEDVDAVRWPEQAVPYDYLLELLERLLAVLMLVERPFEYPCSQLQEGRKLLEGERLALCELDIQGMEVKQQLFEVGVYAAVLCEHLAEGIFQYGRMRRALPDCFVMFLSKQLVSVETFR